MQHFQDVIQEILIICFFRVYVFALLRVCASLCVRVCV